ncbi:MAG: PEP-CTERM sorting domain-containing protein [Phycisphaeraceae bacterium]|nr:PEP-CTERM sorting domain-containing protein [Phycisphaeraceae bacterium]
MSWVASLGLLLAASSASSAAVVDVWVTVDQDTIDIGETGTLTAWAQIKPDEVEPDGGIFAWNVNVRADDPAIAILLAATVDRAGWDNEDGFSSDGVPMPWGISSIFDGSLDDPEKGLNAPVVLFTVQYQGLEPGVVTFSLEPGDAPDEDFLTWTFGTGGDYSQANAMVTVIPEPGSLLLLGLGGLLLRRRRVRD